MRPDSPDGSFWVQRRDTSDPIADELKVSFGGFANAPPAATDRDLFSSDGTFLGSATLPARFRPEDVRGFDVVGVWFDDLDVEYVVKYRRCRLR